MFRLCTIALVFVTSLVAGRSVEAQGPLKPGDRLVIAVSDTTDTLGIRLDGKVVLPRVGPVAVAGLAPAAAEDSVTRAFSQVFARPDIRVTALRRIVVTGEVPNGDLYFVDATVGLAEALALAGGVGPEGNRRRVELWRDGTRVARVDAQSGAALRMPLESGDLVLVARASWWARNPFIIISLISSAVSLVIALSL